MAFAVPIQAVSTTSGNQPRATRIIEESAQTFKGGTPVEVKAADGGLQVWDGVTTTAGIAGVSYEAGSNLGTTGLGAPAPYSPPTGLGATLTFGSVPNEASAKNIPHGAPPNDGRCGLYIASGDTVFSAAFGTTGVATTPAVTDVGVAYGMTLDSNGYWYVDKAKTGAGAVVRITGLDPRETPAAGTLVEFVFLAAAAQLLA